MLGCVAGFGFATVVFAVSTNLWLSLFALAAAGGFDMVSMVIRQTLVQIATPDLMRGRVSAVNFVFIGASNELGEFESGLAAALFGTVPAALVGGLGTLAVVALWARLFPELRHADQIGEARPNRRRHGIAITTASRICIPRSLWSLVLGPDKSFTTSTSWSLGVGDLVGQHHLMLHVR